MENKAKNLEKVLNSFLEKEANIEELSKRGSLLEIKRIQLGLRYLNEKNIKLMSADGFGILSRCLNNSEIKSMDMKIAIHVAETSILSSLNGALDALDAFGGETKKEKADAKKIRKEVLLVAGEILPDYLNGAYDLIQDGNGDGKIYDEAGNLIFDLERFFDGVNKIGHKPAVVNNLPTEGQDAEAAFRKLVKENAKDFLLMIPAIEKEVGASVVKISDGLVPRDKVDVDTRIRKFRRENRPVDKKGNLFVITYKEVETQ